LEKHPIAGFSGKDIKALSFMLREQGVILPFNKNPDSVKDNSKQDWLRDSKFNGDDY